MLRLDRAAWPFLLGAAALAIVPALFWPVWSAVPGVVLGAFFAFFFRDPDRAVHGGAHAVVSPADGRVLLAGPSVPGAAPDGDWLQVSIFLSPMNVHVNRIPIAGTITKVALMPGRFLPAYHHDAATDNERSEIWIDHAGQFVVARQIVGALARRVVCRASVGMQVHAGDRYGVMKFGSRMDLFLPVTARICVAAGERVRAGESLIAVLD